jgi:hypothetical protein
MNKINLLTIISIYVISIFLIFTIFFNFYNSSVQICLIFILSAILLSYAIAGTLVEYWKDNVNNEKEKNIYYNSTQIFSIILPFFIFTYYFNY